MAISLQKGQKVDLTKTNPGLKKILVGLGWDTNKYDGGFDFDLDSAAFLLTDAGKVTSDVDFVFYNNNKHSSQSVIHLGDNLTGIGDGELYRNGAEWKFNAAGSGFQGGLSALCKNFGISV